MCAVWRVRICSLTIHAMQKVRLRLQGMLREGLFETPYSFRNSQTARTCMHDMETKLTLIDLSHIGAEDPIEAHGCKQLSIKNLNFHCVHNDCVVGSKLSLIKI